jgi:hypothetical protein
MISEYDKLSDDFQGVFNPTEMMLKRLDHLARKMGGLAWSQHRMMSTGFSRTAEYYINPKHESEDVADILSSDTRETYETIRVSFLATRVPPSDGDDIFRTKYEITANYSEPLKSIKQVAASYREEVMTAAGITTREQDDNQESREQSEGAEADSEPATEQADGETSIDTVEETEPIIHQKFNHSYEIDVDIFELNYEASISYDIATGEVIDGPYYDSNQHPKIAEVHDEYSGDFELELLTIDQRDPHHENLGDTSLFTAEEFDTLMQDNKGDISHAGNSDEEHARRILGLIDLLMPGMFKK